MAQASEAFVGFGGNLGDPYRAIHQAAQELRAMPGIEAVTLSSCFRTAPVQASGPDFCNAVAHVRTRLTPAQLLDALLAVEHAHGRTRDHWHAPRTLDLDLLAHGDTRIIGSQLTIPHPRAHERAFVLVPLCELNDRVLLGPPESATLMPARHWHGLLSAQSLSDIRPW